MKTDDIIKARGLVNPSFIDLRTGTTMPWDERHNTISHEASFSMANAFGGNMTYIPNRIGFIYGPYENPSLSKISRDQSWSSLETELGSDTLKSDVQVVSFSYSPSVKRITRSLDDSSSSSDSSGSDEPLTDTGYSVTFHAHSDSTTPGAFGTCGYESGTERGQKFTSDTYIYQAVLLNKTGTSYRVIARASLAHNVAGTIKYYKKPANFEVALDWSIKFF